MYIYQTMSNNFGFIDIILLAMIAGFIILRLRNILGRKTGHEAKVSTVFDEKKFEKFKPQEKAKPIAETGLDNDQKIEFLKGAEIAYETILTSFAKGEKAKLSSLLTKNMVENFNNAIDQRNKDNINQQLEQRQYLKVDDEYKYLVSMPIYSLSSEKKEELENEAAKKNEYNKK